MANFSEVYEEILEQFNAMNVPPCIHCESPDTASVQCGVIRLTTGGRKVAGSSPVAPTLHPVTQSVISFEIFMTKKWGVKNQKQKFESYISFSCCCSFFLEWHGC